MRKISTDYGHLNAKAVYNIGIRTRNVGHETLFYGHVFFPQKGVHKRTVMLTNEKNVNTFVTACIDHSKRNDFPFKDEDGVKQWFDFDPHAPTTKGL